MTDIDIMSFETMIVFLLFAFVKLIAGRPRKPPSPSFLGPEIDAERALRESFPPLGMTLRGPLASVVGDCFPPGLVDPLAVRLSTDPPPARAAGGLSEDTAPATGGWGVTRAQLEELLLNKGWRAKQVQKLREAHAAGPAACGALTAFERATLEGGARPPPKRKTGEARIADTLEVSNALAKRVRQARSSSDIRAVFEAVADASRP